MKKKCANPSCGKEFEALRATAQYCSGACKVKAHRAGGPLEPLTTTEPDPVEVFHSEPVMLPETEPVNVYHPSKDQHPPITQAQLDAQPLVFPRDETDKEMRVRMGRIKDYCATMPPKHCLRENKLRIMLKKAGYNPSLAKLAFPKS